LNSPRKADVTFLVNERAQLKGQGPVCFISAVSSFVQSDSLRTSIVREIGRFWRIVLKKSAP